MSRVDALIEAVSPSWAAKRAAARAQLEREKFAASQVRGYNAVARGRRISAEFRTLHDGRPTDEAADLATLRARAREMARNNPYWRCARRTIVSEVVGLGIRATVKGKNKETVAQVQSEWDTWAESRHVDVAGRLDFYAIQRLVMATVMSDGEALVLRHVDRTGALKLKVLGAEFLASERDGELKDGGEIVGGVETDEHGTAVAYHLYKRHPSRWQGSTAIVRWSAEDVAHLFAVDRPNQVRGESWLATVFTRLMDWDDYEDADLMRMKIAACFAAVYTGVGPDGVGPAPGSPGYELHDKIEPGMIEHLPGGSDVKLVTPPASTGIRDAAWITLRGIASGLGITYESLTGDYERVNFSSARMGRLQMLANVSTWQQQIMIDLFCERVWSWFMAARMLRPGPVFRVPSLGVEWVTPRPVLVDPVRETEADVKRVRAGFAPWSAVVREQGRDPVQVAQAIADDIKRFDELGLVLDVDPRKVSVQGQGGINQQQEEANAGTSKPARAA